jgi:hypothetical protein
VEPEQRGYNMKLPDIELYRQEKENWKASGQPVRSDEKVAELYEICISCDEYIAMPLAKDRGQCKICTCLLSKDGDHMNKLRWATTKCPINKWVEEPGYEKKEAEQEVPAQPQFNSRKPKNRDCGCG